MFTLFAKWDCILKPGIAPENEHAGGRRTYFADHHLPMMVGGYFLH